MKNPSANFRFRVDIDGYEQWAIQEFTLPDVEITVREHGEGDKVVKTPSRKKVGNATMKNLHSLTGDNNTGFIWLTEAQLGLPSASEKLIVFRELAMDGITTVATWVLEGCFPTKLSMDTFNRTSDDNTMETLEISVDDIFLLP